MFCLGYASVVSGYFDWLISVVCSIKYHATMLSPQRRDQMHPTLGAIHKLRLQEEGGRW